MARDADALKIQKWAATGDVQDPEDGGLSRSTGWDATYSQPGGNVPKREHINQLFRELSAQGVEVKVHGAGLEWDSSISYEHPAMVMGSDARLYVSVQNSAGADPTSDIINSHWALLESQGPVGPPGTAGSDGSDATALQFDITANREAAGNKGAFFYSTDDDLLQYDDGAAWQDIVKRVVIPFIIDGGGAVITTGEKGHLPPLPRAMTVTGWTILGDVSGSIVVDVAKDTYANFPPAFPGDSIAGTEKPTLSSAQKNQDRTLSSWTTALAKDDILAFKVDSAATVTRVTLGLEGTM